MRKNLFPLLLGSLFSLSVQADENLFGYIKGSEVLPDGA